MSTEHQQYSTENQALALSNTHKLTVLQSLTLIAILRKAPYGLRGDPAFGNCCEMSQKAVPLTKPFWFMTLAGRDDSKRLTRPPMKALKRAMAGEYSRELSIKVFAGQKRLASTQKAVHPSLLFAVEAVASSAPEFRVVSVAGGWLRPSADAAGPPESYAADSGVVEP